MVFQFKFDLHRKFIDHYEKYILVPYSHLCQVKFKRVPIIVFKYIALKHMHTYIYTQVCKN